MLGIRKPRHANPMKIGFYFKCPICINHQLWLDSMDETLSYVQKHNTLYHYGKGN